MAINKISGNILQDNLQRGANLSIQGNLAYFDISNSRVGILTDTPGDTFTVAGIANATDVRITSSTPSGIFYASGNRLVVNDSNLTFDGSTLTLLGTANIANLSISGNIETAGNITGGNIGTTGNVSAGNVVSTGLVQGVDLITQTANIGNVNISGNSISADSGILELGSNANISITGGSPDYVLATDGTGNLVWVAGGNIVGSLGNLAISNTTILSNIANANITLQPSNNQTVIIDTTSGLVIPVGTELERPSPAATGTIRFNVNIGRIEVYDGTEWDSMVSGVTNQLFAGDNSTLTFVLDRASTSAATLVMFNGVVQIPTVAYTVTGNLITFVEPPLTSDIIDIRFL